MFFHEVTIIFFIFIFVAALHDFTDAMTFLVVVKLAARHYLKIATRTETIAVRGLSAEAQINTAISAHRMDVGVWPTIAPLIRMCAVPV